VADALTQAPEPDAGKPLPRDLKGRIHFENVVFRYPDRPTLFNGIDFHVDGGETVGITGVNGAGKSTLAHLLLRFAEPDGGRITIDGTDIREFSLRELRSRIGLVSQNVLLLNASIADNIGLGREGATMDQIVAAAKSALAHEFIASLPHGYDTVVGDDGVLLSGGQKQRISLARALLKDPAILVLDEATAMFDPAGERAFVARCREEWRARTVLLITHRPASLELADRILRLEDGILRRVDTPVAISSARAPG
jgi:ABC-type multidrug transport system fused ATPase/permease subunit